MERFWSKVNVIEDEDSCWNWLAGKSWQGYGKFSYPTGQLAHRFSWELHHGEIPDGMQVLHSCDNPSCVRPSHLFLGDNTANMQDRHAKGRYKTAARGENHGMARFTEDDIAYIRNSTKTSKDLAAEFNTNYNYINQIKRGDSWKHLK